LGLDADFEILKKYFFQNFSPILIANLCAITNLFGMDFLIWLEWKQFFPDYWHIKKPTNHNAG